MTLKKGKRTQGMRRRRDGKNPGIHAILKREVQLHPTIISTEKGEEKRKKRGGRVSARR